MEIISIQEAADIYRVSAETVTRWIKRGRLPRNAAGKIGGKWVLIKDLLPGVGCSFPDVEARKETEFEKAARDYEVRKFERRFQK